MLDKKQIQDIFLWEVKLGHKASETTCNINKALEPGTANEYTVQWWFKKFSKGDKSLEDEDQKLTTTNWEDHRSWSSYNYTRSCQRIQCWLFCGRLAFEANWKGEKAP